MDSDERGTDRRRKRRIRAWAFVAVGLLIAGAAAVGYGMWRWDVATHPRPVDLTEIARLTGLSFPASATLVESSFVAGPRPSLEAKIYIDRVDMDPFKESSQFPREWAEGWGIYDPANVEWWESPTTGPDVWYTDVFTPRPTPRGMWTSFAGVVVVVAPRDADTAVVYIYGAPP